MVEYAVYKGDDLIIIGTAKECAQQLGVSEKYIRWLSSPTAKRRLEKIKDQSKCMTAVRLDDDEQ